LRCYQSVLNRRMAKSKDTKPELLVQEQLKKWSIQFDCHARDLPGTPDLVFRNDKIAVLIHGCFWHQHGDCLIARDISKMDSNWTMKFVKSSQYDVNIISELKNLNWKVLVLWECEIYSDVYSEAEKVIRMMFLNSLQSDVKSR